MSQKEIYNKFYIENKDKLIHKSNGMNYYLVRVLGNQALIRVIDRLGNERGFEVWKLRPATGKYANSHNIRFPSNEEFGYFGWSYQGIELAERKLEEVTKQ